MRRWIRSLHGGQLVMLIAVVLGASAPMLWLSNLYSTSANADFKNASDAQFGSASFGFKPDTTMAGAFQRRAGAEISVSGRWILGAFALWLFCLVALWIWFGARRRNVITAEIIHE